MTIRIADLETGDLTQFDATTLDGGDLSVNEDAAAHGIYGLQALIDDTNLLDARIYESMGEEFWHGFYFKIDLAFVQNDGDSMQIFRDTVDSWDSIFYMLLHTKINPSGQFGLDLVGCNDGAVEIHLPGSGDSSLAIDPGRWYHIEIHWKRSSSTSANDGEIDFWLDGVLIDSDHAFDSYDGKADAYRFRTMLFLIDAGTSGKLYYDDIKISNEGRIYPIWGDDLYFEAINKAPNKIYNGFFVYPGQHTQARAAAGCSNEVEFAKVCATDMKSIWGANVVMIATGTFAGDNGLVNTAISYIHQGMDVILYPQGDCYFRGWGASKWDADKVTAGLNILKNAVLIPLANHMRHIVGICVTEESAPFADNGSGGIDWSKFSPFLCNYWNGIKLLTDLPLIYLNAGYIPFMNIVAALDDDCRCNVYLIQNSANLHVDGIPKRGSPIIDDMIDYGKARLVEAENILGSCCILGHQPKVSGIPEADLTGVGWESYLAGAEYYWRLLNMGREKRYKYQISWEYVQHNGSLYLPLVDRDYKLTDLGSSLRNMLYKDTRGFDVM